jgi:outer membrane biosynthesis protein TonB
MAKKEFTGPTRKLFQSTSKPPEEEKPQEKKETTPTNSENKAKSQKKSDEANEKQEKAPETRANSTSEAQTNTEERVGQGDELSIKTGQPLGVKDASMKVLMTKAEKERLWSFCQEPLCPYKSPSDLARAAISSLLDSEEKILEEHKKEFEKIRNRLSRN